MSMQEKHNEIFPKFKIGRILGGIPILSFGKIMPFMFHYDLDAEICVG